MIVTEVDRTGQLAFCFGGPVLVPPQVVHLRPEGWVRNHGGTLGPHKGRMQRWAVSGSGGGSHVRRALVLVLVSPLALDLLLRFLVRQDAFCRFPLCLQLGDLLDLVVQAVVKAIGDLPPGWRFIVFTISMSVVVTIESMMTCAVAARRVEGAMTVVTRTMSG